MKIEVKAELRGETLFADITENTAKSKLLDEALWEFIDLRKDHSKPLSFNIAGTSLVLYAVRKWFAANAPALLSRAEFVCVEDKKWVTKVARFLDKRSNFRHLSRLEFNDGLR